MPNNVILKNSCILIGGGNSIREPIEQGLWDKIRGQDIWSLNWAYKTMPYLPTREIWIDVGVFKDYIVDIQKLSEQGVKLHAKAHPKYNGIPQINQHQWFTEGEDDGVKLWVGRTNLTGMFALSLAVKEGYKNIYLLGFDYGTIGSSTKTHYYQDVISVKSFGVGAVKFYKDGNGDVDYKVKDFMYYLKFPNKIWNVGLYSNIPYFEKISYTDFYSQIASDSM